MAEEEYYDIVPHKEVSELKKHVTSMSDKHAAGASQPSHADIIAALHKVSKSMEGMLKIFSEAAQDMDTDDAKVNTARIEAIEKKVNTILTQNKTIAEGMVAVNDTVNDFVSNQSTPGRLSPRVVPRAAPPQAPAAPIPPAGFGAPKAPSAPQNPPIAPPSSLGPLAKHSGPNPGGLPGPGPNPAPIPEFPEPPKPNQGAPVPPPGAFGSPSAPPAQKESAPSPAAPPKKKGLFGLK